jgi:hypothetical protein
MRHQVTTISTMETLLPIFTLVGIWLSKPYDTFGEVKFFSDAITVYVDFDNDD